MEYSVTCQRPLIVWITKLFLIRSYLVDRSQRVFIKDSYSSIHYSEWNKVKTGVPQGSILGLLFFLFYINDLPGTIKQISLPTLFADDINIICVQRSLEWLKDDYASVLVKVNRWFQDNSLILNLNKTNLVQFATKTIVDIPICIELGQYQLINSQTTNFLGLTLDYTLSWSPHTEWISNKLKSACYIHRILKPTLTLQNLRWFILLTFIPSYLMALYFGRTLLIAMKYLNYKRGLSELWPIPIRGHPVASCFRIWASYLSVPSTYYCSLCC